MKESTKQYKAKIEAARLEAKQLGAELARKVAKKYAKRIEVTFRRDKANGLFPDCETVAEALEKFIKCLMKSN